MGQGLGLPTVLLGEALFRLPQGCEAPYDPNLIQSQRASSIDVQRDASGCRCAKEGGHLLAARHSTRVSAALSPEPDAAGLDGGDPGGQSLPQNLVWAPNMAAPHAPHPHPHQCHQASLDPGFGTWPHC